MRRYRTLPAAVVAMSLSMGVTSAHASGLVSNEFQTFSQVAWGNTPAPGTIAQVLNDNFNAVFTPQLQHDF